MNLSTGCGYCGNLICHDSLLTIFSCAKNKSRKLENAGACFVGVGNHKVIVENCPDFERGPTRNLIPDNVESAFSRVAEDLKIKE